MFYKPKYCCNCGEEIEKTDWSIFSSGRFCDVCKEDFKPQEWLPKIIVLGGIGLSLFGFGSLLQSDEKNVNPSLKQFTATENIPKKTVKETNLPASPNSSNQNSANFNGREIVEKQLPVANKPKEQTAREKSETKTAEIETTYFCGAATKKGNPCSRRVKGGGRCWQHAGQAAILPPEKLIASR